MTRRFVALCGVIALALVAIGARTLMLADSSSLVPDAVLVAAFVFGLSLPLAVLLYAMRRQRVAVVALAFCLGLTVNVAFLANAVPANAASGNTSVFYLDGAVSSACGNAPMWQTNADTGPGSFTGGAGVQYKWCSDTFASTQSLNAGTITASVVLSNTSSSKDCLFYGELFWWHASSSTSTSIGQSLLQTLPQNTNLRTVFTWSWATSAVAFADGDMLQFLFRFQSSGSNCGSSVAWSTTLAQPSQITVATIVPEGVAALLPLALAVPLAARWWKRRRP